MRAVLAVELGVVALAMAHERVAKLEETVAAGERTNKDAQPVPVSIERY